MVPFDARTDYYVIRVAEKTAFHTAHQIIFVYLPNKHLKSYLYVLTIPDDFGNLYDYPAGALNEIRRTMSQDLDFYLEGTSKVSLFLYDNKTLIVENFNDEPVEMNLVANGDAKVLTNLEDNTIIQATSSEMTVKKKKVTVNKFAVKVKPHSYVAFSY